MRPDVRPRAPQPPTVVPATMDLIVSTPQGEAEISVNAVHESVTVGDLLGRVLNSAPPNLVYVDGRPTPTGTLITRSRPRDRVGDRAQHPARASGRWRGHVGASRRRRRRQSPAARTWPLLVGNGAPGQRCAADVQPSAGAPLRDRRRAFRTVSPLPPTRAISTATVGDALRHRGKTSDCASAIACSGSTARSRTAPRRCCRLPSGSSTSFRGPRDEPAAEPEPNGRPRNGGKRLRNRRNQTRRRGAGAHCCSADPAQARLRSRTGKHPTNPSRPCRSRPAGNEAVRAPVGTPTCRRRRVHLQRRSRRSTLDTGGRR